MTLHNLVSLFYSLVRGFPYGTQAPSIVYWCDRLHRHITQRDWARAILRVAGEVYRRAGADLDPLFWSVVIEHGQSGLIQ